MLKRARLAALVMLLAVALLCLSILAVAKGAAEIPLADTARLMWAGISGGTIAHTDVTAYSIVWELRTPRVLSAALVGAGLSLAGVACQALVRNPLADPFILGISSGASVGASLVVATGFLSGLGMFGMASAALIGAAVAAVLVFCLSSSAVEGINPVRMVLTGVVLAFGFQGLASAIVFFDPVGDSARTVMFWLLGSLGGARWSMVPLVAAVVALAFIVLRRLAPALDVLAQGDEVAAALGLDPTRMRIALFLVVVVTASVLVAVAGTVGFVGLVVPHLVRLILGPVHGRVIVIVPFVGALLLVGVDLLSRIVVEPRELPLGVVTAIIGVPVFLWVLRRRGAQLGAGQ